MKNFNNKKCWENTANVGPLRVDSKGCHLSSPCLVHLASPRVALVQSPKWRRNAYFPRSHFMPQRYGRCFLGRNRVQKWGKAHSARRFSTQICRGAQAAPKTCCHCQTQRNPDNCRVRVAAGTVQHQIQPCINLGLNGISRREFTSQLLSGALTCPALCPISRWDRLLQ